MKLENNKVQNKIKKNFLSIFKLKKINTILKYQEIILMIGIALIILIS